MKRGITILHLATALLLVACSTEDAPQPKDSIRLEVVNNQTTNTRASLFESLNDLKAAGNFTVQAYFHEAETGTDYTKYIDARVNYFADAEGQKDENGKSLETWRFFDGTNYYTSYWPNNGYLDFLAYMPYDLTGCNYIDKTSIGYTSSGVTFNATLPESSQNEETVSEFIYALSKNQQKDTNSGRVELQFVHPFAVVYFKLKQSLRLNPLESITFKSIYHQGTYLNDDNTGSDTFTSGTWTPTGTATEHKFEIGKTIPDDINFNTVFAGPFLVMPQSINGVNMHIAGTRADNGTFDPIPTPIYTETLKTWEPGMKYTYVLNLGDPGAEILFDVLVERWDAIPYKNIIEVE
ncbi:MAG: fimbrillin family protein [Bacteroides sp.]|nr:fimbrillin family protein [Bacteroides sp.]